MNLREKINADFIAAYKEKNMVKKNFLGVLKGDIENMAGKGLDVTDVSIMKILMSMEKSLKITNTDESKLELTFLNPYLPSQLSDEELDLRIKEFLLDVVALNPNTNENVIIGKTIGKFNSEYKGQAEISVVREKIIELLN